MFCYVFFEIVGWYCFFLYENMFRFSQRVLYLNRIDHTYKNYVGGAQKRPDAYYGRPVHNERGQTIGVVAESNRKDVRDAVEAAKKASAG